MTVLTPTVQAGNGATRYIPANNRRYLWFSTIAATNLTPTGSEINAATDLTLNVAAVAGFMVQGNTVDAPDAGSSFTGKTPGRTTADNSSLTCYISKTGTTADVRSLLSRGQAGYVGIANEGLVTGKTMDVFPATILSLGKSQDIEANATVEVSVSITSTPGENLVIP